MQCIQTYVIDTYVTFAASALATVTVLRSTFGTVFPLFDPVLYKKLGYNWGNTVLISIQVIELYLLSKSLTSPHQVPASMATTSAVFPSIVFMPLL